jgi:pimeloyl-ACP methyl ester carboxylesterase
MQEVSVARPRLLLRDLRPGDPDPADARRVGTPGRWGVLALCAALVACGAPTPPFRDANGRVLRGSIAEEGRMPVGGVPQWLLLRGRDAGAPVLLVLHGGPGSSETVLFRRFVGPALEDRLVVAYWDQRGAGRSYDPAIPRESMTVARFLDDLDAVVDHLRRRLGRDRVVLLGHSWGSALGLLYVARHPEKVAAWIGVAQVASMPAGEAMAWQGAREAARRRGDARGAAELDAIGPPPHDVGAMWTLRRHVAAAGGEFHLPPARWSLVAWALGSGEASLADLWRLWRGSAFTMEAMWPEVRALDVAAQVPWLEVPATFLLGRHDGVVPAPLSAEYAAALRAPALRLAWFGNSAHNPPFEEPEAFVAAVLRAVEDAAR